MNRLHYAALIFFFTGIQAFAEVEISFSGVSTETFSEEQLSVSYDLPVGPFQNGVIESLQVRGSMLKKAWEITKTIETVDSLSENLRKQLKKSGFEILYECNSKSCGGFDFRFNTVILPDPEMHIDLGSFKFFSGRSLSKTPREFVSCIVSRGGESLFVQLFFIGDEAVSNLKIKSLNKVSESVEGSSSSFRGTIKELLDLNGSAILSDVIFKAGSSELIEGEYLSLVDLAKYLKQNKGIKIALVGHTDAEGDLAKNIELSKDRAEIVKKKLISKFNVKEERLDFHGIGFLSPRSSNSNAKGRSDNRRVEVIVIK
jgi:outer membrane protein OmpA-like peptidoglycan-associated protein